MLRLVEDLGDGGKVFYPLDKESMIIGREKTCDIVLSGDTVSKRHACIHQTDMEWVVEDLGSPNGVFVGNKKVRGSTEIQTGDTIMIGNHFLMVEEVLQDQSLLDDTVVMFQPRKLRTPVNAFAPEDRENGISETRKINREELVKLAIDKASHPDEVPFVEVIEGPDKGEIYALTIGEVFLGRSSDCHIKLSDPSISATHAKFVYRKGGYQIIDLDSRNGIFIEDLQVRAHPLSSGEIIKIGSTRLRYDDGKKMFKQDEAPIGEQWNPLLAKSEEKREGYQLPMAWIVAISVAVAAILIILLIWFA